jgi:hypothetical protein
MKVVDAPVSTRMFVRYPFTDVVKKIKDEIDGFVFTPEATPSFDDPGPRNLGRPWPRVQAGYIEDTGLKKRSLVMDLWFEVDGVDL